MDKVSKTENKNDKNVLDFIDAIYISFNFPTAADNVHIIILVVYEVITQLTDTCCL